MTHLFIGRATFPIGSEERLPVCVFVPQLSQDQKGDLENTCYSFQTIVEPSEIMQFRGSPGESLLQLGRKSEQSKTSCVFKLHHGLRHVLLLW